LMDYLLLYQVKLYLSIYVYMMNDMKVLP